MSQNASPLTTASTVLQALAKGVCPICTLVRAYQNELIEQMTPQGATRFCNFHAWAIAASAPATSAAYVFVAMLKDHREMLKAGGIQDCDLCTSVRAHEIERLKEFERDMQRERFADWIQNYGTVCRWHGEELQSMLPSSQAQAIKKLLAANERELQEALVIFARKARHGGHAGGGILGKAAEFLVAQRGITR